MEQIQYFKDVYSKIWVYQTKNYGYEEYVQRVVQMIGQSSPQRVFEVGIGTGWPIGVALKEKGIMVDGCDVADNLVAAAQKELGNPDGIWCGEVSEYRGDILYDVTYCVRTSWCIPNFYFTLKKMISMTKLGGYVIFDVMDKNSPYCLKHGMTGMRERYYKFLGINVDERYKENYISIRGMKRFLKKAGMTYQYWGEREITENRDKYNTPKVVFMCRKEG